jgi:hypothetical protein
MLDAIEQPYATEQKPGETIGYGSNCQWLHLMRPMEFAQSVRADGDIAETRLNQPPAPVCDSGLLASS